MFGNYEGSLKGSGVDSYSEDFGTFVCEAEDCGHENKNALKYVDDWGEWSVTCENCDTTHQSGNIRTIEHDWADDDPDPIW